MAPAEHWQAVLPVPADLASHLLVQLATALVQLSAGIVPAGHAPGVTCRCGTVVYPAPRPQPPWPPAPPWAVPAVPGAGGAPAAPAASPRSQGSGGGAATEPGAGAGGGACTAPAASAAAAPPAAPPLRPWTGAFHALIGDEDDEEEEEETAPSEQAAADSSVHEDSTKRIAVPELVRFHTSKSGKENICLNEYVERMKAGQRDIYYIAGESITAVSSSPCLNEFRKKGLEVLYLVEPNELAVRMLKQFEGKMLKPATEEHLGNEDEDEKKELEVHARMDSTSSHEVADLLRPHTSKSGNEQFSPDQRVARLKGGQSDIYHTAGKSITAISTSLCLANLRKKDLEALDPVAPDALAAQQLEHFEGQPKHATEERSDNEDEDEKNKFEVHARIDSTHGHEPADLLRFHTSKTGNEQISLVQYVDRMREGQSDIYYITCESIATASAAPFLEEFRKKGLEVLYLLNPSDECAVQQLKGFHGRLLKSATIQGSEAEDEDEKKKLEKLKITPEPPNSLRFHTSTSGGEQTSQKMYVDRMKESQHQNEHERSGNGSTGSGAPPELLEGKILELCDFSLKRAKIMTFACTLCALTKTCKPLKCLRCNLTVCPKCAKSSMATCRCES